MVCACACVEGRRACDWLRRGGACRERVQQSTAAPHPHYGPDQQGARAGKPLASLSLRYSLGGGLYLRMASESSSRVGFCGKVLITRYSSVRFVTLKRLYTCQSWSCARRSAP